MASHGCTPCVKCNLLCGICFGCVCRFETYDVVAVRQDINTIPKPMPKNLDAWRQVFEEAQYDKDFKIFTHNAVNTVQETPPTIAIGSFNPESFNFEAVFDINSFTGCFIDKYKTKTWYVKGTVHREDGPAMEYADGTKYWYRNGQLHRKDGPAVECNNGTKLWYQNGLLHREDGPAVEYSNGDEDWCINGWLHREDGPAIKRSNCKEWLVNGKFERKEHEEYNNQSNNKISACNTISTCKKCGATNEYINDSNYICYACNNDL